MFSFTIYEDENIAYLYVEPRTDEPIAFAHEEEGLVYDVDHHGNLKGIELHHGLLNLRTLIANYPNVTAVPNPVEWRELTSMIDPLSVDRLIRRLSLAPGNTHLSIEFGRPCVLNFLVPRPPDED